MVAMCWIGDCLIVDGWLLGVCYVVVKWLVNGW